MNYDKFCNVIMENIKDYLPQEYQNAEVILTEVEKNNGVQKTGICIKNAEENAFPTIYLEGFYDQMLHGRSFQEIYKEIAEIRCNNKIPKQISMKDLLDYQNVKDKIVMDVVGVENNELMLAKVPHRLVHDMAITYKILVSSKESEVATIRINNNIMKELWADEETLYEDAIKNTPKLQAANFSSLSDTLIKLLNNSELENEEEMKEFIAETKQTGEVPMYVLTNELNTYGAATLFYPGMKEWVAEQIGGNYFVLPSSVHEVLILPDNGSMDFMELKNMVSEINKTQVSPEEVLTNEVYFYDGESKQLCKAADKGKVKNKLVEQMKGNMQKDEKHQAKKQKTIKKHNKNIGLEP